MDATWVPKVAGFAFGGYYKSCMTLRTLNLENNGTIVYQGHAGFIVSTVARAALEYSMG